MSRPHKPSRTSYLLSLPKSRLAMIICIPLVVTALLFLARAVTSHPAGSLPSAAKGSPDTGYHGTINETIQVNRTGFRGYKRPGFEAPLAGGIPLRIMCLGASTTRGDSTEEGIDNNGFRRPLRDKLVAAGNKVNMVGTQREGNMTDNDMEAYPGMRTDQIHEKAREAIPLFLPNVFVLNAGANDCFQHTDIPNFYQRYHLMVRDLLLSSPRATIIMCTLLPTTETATFSGREDVIAVNPQIRQLAKLYQDRGWPVVLVEMQGPDGIQDENLAFDGMHPGTAGYEMMATKMFGGLVEADARGFLRTPETMEGVPDDGEDERRDQSYYDWLAEKNRLDEEAEKTEQQELGMMTLWINEEDEKLKNLVGQRSDSPPRSNAVGGSSQVGKPSHTLRRRPIMF